MRRINKKGQKLISKILAETDGIVDIYFKKGVLILDHYNEREYFRINNNNDYKEVFELVFGPLN